MISPVQYMHNQANLELSLQLCDGIAMVPFYGTLLGLTRSGALIDGDDDIDFWVDQHDRSAVIAALAGSPLEIDLSAPTNQSPHFLQSSRKIDGVKTFVDFYFFENLSESASCIDRWNFRGQYQFDTNALHVPKDLVFPFKAKSYQGIEMQLPHNPEGICEFLYGSDWRTPLAKGSEYFTIIVDHQPKIIRRLAGETNQLFNARLEEANQLTTVDVKIAELEGYLKQLNDLRGSLIRKIEEPNMVVVY